MVKMKQIQNEEILKSLEGVEDNIIFGLYKDSEDSEFEIYKIAKIDDFEKNIEDLLKRFFCCAIKLTIEKENNKMTSLNVINVLNEFTFFEKTKIEKAGSNIAKFLNKNSLSEIVEQDSTLEKIIDEENYNFFSIISDDYPIGFVIHGAKFSLIDFDADFILEEIKNIIGAEK